MESLIAFKGKFGRLFVVIFMLNIVACNGGDLVYVSTENQLTNQVNCSYSHVLTPRNFEHLKLIVKTIYENNQLRDLLDHCIYFENTNSESLKTTFKNQLLYMVPQQDFMFSFLVLSAMSSYIEVTNAGDGFGHNRGTRKVVVPASDTGIIAHELFHVFAFSRTQNSGFSASEEGVGIALSNLVRGYSVDLKETVFGTKLFYRDIGVTGFPREIGFGSLPSTSDQVMMGFINAVMQKSAPFLNLLSQSGLQSEFDTYWKCLNRSDTANWIANVRKAESGRYPCK